jgi:hypothetical protein
MRNFPARTLGISSWVRSHIGLHALAAIWMSLGEIEARERRVVDHARQRQHHLVT